MQNSEVTSSRAVEIAVLLGDSVLAVHHLSDPRGGRVSRATRALFASAALGAIACAFAVTVGVVTAGANRQAERAWLDDGNAGIDFRPRRLSPLLDVLAAAGLVSAVAGAAWGLARLGRERRPSSFRVGRGAGVDLALDVDDFAVVAPDGDSFRFAPAPRMTVLEGQAGPIAHGARVRAEIGPLGVLISGVAPPRAPATAAKIDRRTLGYGLASAAAHGALLFLCLLLPATARGFSEDELGREVRMTRASFIPTEPKPPEPATGTGAGGQGAALPSERGVGPEGERGRPEATEHGKAKVLQVSATPSIAPPRDRVERARTAGVLGVMNAQRDSLTVLTATGDFTSGFDDADIRGAWEGPAYADNRGFGTGFHDHGPGGGGLEPNTIGAGPYHVPYSNMHLPPGQLPGRKPRPPTVVIGQITTPGYADKETIRRYVHARASQIAWCYEKQLAVRPTLAGTVVTEFTIRTDGRVLEAAARGLGDDAVESCVAEVIRGIAFPAGQVVHVTSYPFTFHAVGSGT